VETQTPWPCTAGLFRVVQLRLARPRGCGAPARASGAHPNERPLVVVYPLGIWICIP